MEPTVDNPTEGSSLPWRWAVGVGSALALLAAAVVATEIYLSMLDHGHDWWRLFAWQAGGFAFWALVSPLALAHGSRLAPATTRPRWWLLALVGWAAALTALHVVASGSWYLLFQAYEPVARYDLVQSLARARSSWVPVDPLIYGGLVVIGYGVGGYREARRAVVRKSRLEADLARSQLDALRLEIQPHFLFNTLNAIAGQVRRGADGEALKMLLALSELLRATLDRSVRPEVALREELELAGLYASLQQVRFGDRLRVSFDVDESCLDEAVPVFLLQPLLENAIRHGIGRRAGPGRVEVRGRRRGDRLLLVVADDGVGLPQGFELEERLGVGLGNTRSRLERLYGEAASFELAGSAGGGVEARVTLPAASRPAGRVASA